MSFGFGRYGRLLLQTMSIFFLASQAAGAGEVWTLAKSVQRALLVAPEQQEAKAGIAIRQSELERAGDWPNPTISLRAQNRLGLQDGRGGYNLDQLVISQPLPLWRLQKQQAVASKQLSAEQDVADQTRLAVQYDIARLYYAVLLSHEKLLLAEQRQRFAHSVQHGQAHRNRKIVQYINPLDRHRIELLDEDARRTLLHARAIYSDSLHMFRLRLQLPEKQGIDLPALRPAADPQPMSRLQRRQEASSASLKQMHDQIQANQANVALEKYRKFDDPVVSLIHERDFLAGRRQNFNGIMLSMPIPLWDRNQANIDRAKAEVLRSQSRLHITERDLHAQLQQNYLNLSQLLEQLGSLDRLMIKPARNLLDLTRKSYEVGEVNSLNLIDAYNTYFNARNTQLDLMYQSQIADLDLHQTVGDPLLGLLKAKP